MSWGTSCAGAELWPQATERQTFMLRPHHGTTALSAWRPDHGAQTMAPTRAGEPNRQPVSVPRLEGADVIPTGGSRCSELLEPRGVDPVLLDLEMEGRGSLQASPRASAVSRS